MRSFGMTLKRITDPRSLGSRCIKGTEKSFPRVDSSVPLMHRDPSDLGSVIVFRIIPKKPTLRFDLKYPPRVWILWIHDPYLDLSKKNAKSVFGFKSPLRVRVCTRGRYFGLNLNPDF